MKSRHAAEWYVVKNMLRKTLDNLVGGTIERVGFRRSGLLVLTYHRVLPRDYSDLSIVEPGMLTHEDTFRMHLSVLKRHFDVVDLGQWLEDRRAGKLLPERACAITFDDGWGDNYQYAFPALKDFRVPATIFVVAGLVGTEKQFWPERLARAIVHRGGEQWSGKQSAFLNQLLAGESNFSYPVDVEQISHVVQRAKRYSDADIHKALDEVNRVEGLPDKTAPDLLDWEQCREMVLSGLVSIGSHTANHVRLLAGISREVLETEVQGSKQQISAQIGIDCELFCYPNGDVCDEAVAAVESSYSGACTTKVGWNSTESQPYLLSRINIHEGRTATASSFLMRLTGWL